MNQLAAKILTEPPKRLNSEIYSENLNSFVLEIMLQKEPERRPYVNQLLRNARQYFSDDTMRNYREKILPIIKTKYTGQDVDYIYQVLIEGNQYKTTHNFFKRE